MPLRVLIVEDNLPERRGLRAFVERLPALSVYDVEIFEAADGDEGLQAFRDHDPDLALIDLLLPKLDGISLCRQIRSAHGGDLVGLIANSGVYRDAGVARELAGLRAELLAKPLDHRVLARKVLAALEQRKALDAERARGWLRAPAARPARRSGRVPQIGGAVAEQDVDHAEAQAQASSSSPVAASELPSSAPLPGPGLRRLDTSVDAATIDFNGPARGNLEQVPLPALLLRAADQGATGTLKLTRGKVRKVIFILRGTPVFVDSNLRNETLGAYLVAQGKIDETQLARAMREARASKKKLGEALVALRLTNAGTVEEGLRAQTGIKIISALRWPDGAFQYTVGHDFKGKVPNCPVDVVPLVLSALAHFFDGEELRARVAALLEHGVRLTSLGRTHLESILRVFGHELLAEDTDRLPLRHLMDRAADGAVLLAQVEALRRCGMAELTPLAPAQLPPGVSLAPVAGPAAPMPPPGSPGAMPALGSAMPKLGGPGAAVPGAMPMVAGGQPTMPPVAATRPATPGSPGSQVQRGSEVQRLAELPAQHNAARTRSLRGSAGLPRFSLGPTRASSFADGSQTIELELDAPTAPAFELRDLAPTRGHETSGQEPPVPVIELELEQPVPAPPRWVDQDSGVLEIPSTDGLELEEPAEPALLLSATVAPPGSLDALAGTPPAVDLATADPATADVALAERSPGDVAVAAVFQAVKAGIDRARPLPPPSPVTPRGADLGQDRQHVAALEQALNQAPAGPLDPLRRHDYEQRLAHAEPLSAAAPDTFGAELYFQEGEGLLRSNDVKGAVQAFERAVEANPEQPEYHGMVGWALFLQRGRGVAGALAARPHFERAFQITPDSVRVHELAGRVEEDAHDHEAAAHHLGRALRFGPPRMDLFSSIKDLLTRAGNFTRLEQHYRDMILRLREHPQRTLPLWVDLAHLYHEKLNQRQNARLALQVAAKMAPGDPRVQAAQSAIEAAAAGPWEPIAEGHRQRLLANALDPGPLHQLFALHENGARSDLVLTVGSILLARGAATVAEHTRLEALRPPTLVRARQPLSLAFATLCKHASDDPDTQEVVAELGVPLSQFFPVDERLGVAAEAVAPSELPGPLREALSYAAEQLGVALPPIHRTQQLDRLAPRPGLGEGLLVGDAAWSDEDQRRLAFGAARALACLAPGRREVFVRRATDLKVALLGALTACRKGTKVPDPDGRVEGFRTTLSADPARVQRLQALLDRLFGAGGKLNLSEWMRGVQRTSCRVGALVGGDLLAALELVATDAGARDDLVDFALSPEYAAARRERGVAIG